MPYLVVTVEPSTNGEEVALEPSRDTSGPPALRGYRQSCQLRQKNNAAVFDAPYRFLDGGILVDELLRLFLSK